MKKRLVLLAVLPLAVVTMSLKAGSLPSEEEAIKEVIRRQNDASYRHSIEDEAAVWAHEPYVMRLSKKVTIGWESIAADYRKQFAKPQRRADQTFTYSNFRIRISGTSAWAVFDQKMDFEFEGKKQSQKSLEIRFFEKTEGQWKIVLQLSAPQTGS